MTFNRSRNNGSGRGGGFSSKGGFRPRFNDRGPRGPVEMHQAVCDNCQQNCEVPFRPTSGKPIFCSNCFENKRGSDSRPGRFEDRPKFEAVCADCQNNCKVPFQPSNDKPVFCSNCFGGKKNAGVNNGNGKFEEINAKLDTILKLLEDKKPAKKTKVKEVTPAAEEQTPI